MKITKLSRFAIIAFFTLSTFVPMTHAQTTNGAGFTPLAPIPGLTDQGAANSVLQGSFTSFFNKLYLFMIGAAVVLAIIMIIWGGFEYALSEAITSKTAGRQKIVQALFGLALVLSPALVFYIINPAILQLNVNFPALQTPWGKNSPSSNTTSTTDFGGGNTSDTTCGSDGCSSQISGCSGGATTCISTDGTTRYNPGTNGAASGSCNPGDTFECYTYSTTPF